MRKTRSKKVFAEYSAKTLRHLDDVNIRILKEIARIGCRNLSEIARAVGIPKRTIYARITKLCRESGLRVHMSPRHAPLGMVNAVILAKVKPGSHGFLRKALSTIDYLHRLYRAKGAVNGFYAHFTVPADRVREFEKIIGEIGIGLIAQSHTVLYTTDYMFHLPDFSFFDVKSRMWRFEIPFEISAGLNDEELGLKEPDSFRLQADWLDVAIVYVLEKDAMSKLSEVVKERLSSGESLSRPLLKYHYDVHVEDKLIGCYWVRTPRFPPETFGLYLLNLRFENMRGLKDFASLIVKTPFIVSLAKELGEKRLLVELEMPVSRAMDLLDSIEERLFREYEVWEYQLAVLREVEAWKPVPLHLFDEDKGWLFDVNRYMSELEKMSSS